MEPVDRPVALFAALDAEARALVRHLTPSTRPSPELSIWAGVIESTPVVLVVTGVGKVAAALAAQFVCDAFHPRCAIAFGLAGATASDVRPGHLIVASGAMQHDMDARPLTDARGTIPSLGMTVLPSDRTLSEKLRRAADGVVDNSTLVSSGLVLTGDQIVTSREIRDGVLKEFPAGACFDMETAAIAQVAYQNGIPWAALRMTSDAADESFKLDEVLGFGIDTAASLFEQIVRALLKDM
jgi:adenosylhomocysteine nucleosidase